MIADRQLWKVPKEVTIRSMHFEALFKMGLRFKNRFWERVTPSPTAGGQSTSQPPTSPSAGWSTRPTVFVIETARSNQGPGVCARLRLDDGRDSLVATFSNGAQKPRALLLS
jgi:hypothetical protein